MSKKKIFLILLLIALALPVGISLSKYLYNFVNDYLMEANNFFFSHFYTFSADLRLLEKYRVGNSNAGRALCENKR